jgi:hypothetical protein
MHSRPVRLALASLVVVLAIGWIWWESGSNERAVRHALRELARDVAVRRAGDAVSQAFEPTAMLRVPDLPELSGGGAEVRRFLNELHARYESVALSLDDCQIEIADEGRAAHVRGDATYVLRRPGSERSDVRRFEALLTKHGGAWKIRALEVASDTDDQPEARP